MNKLYIVKGSSGSYDYWNTWLVRAFDTIEGANGYVALLTKLSATSKDWDEDTIASFRSDYDARFNRVFGEDVNYLVEVVDLSK